MSYEVIARKWRPQQFADVVGQEHVVQTLENAIKHERLAHAYLFVGPRGVGKTSIARILSKALNCAKGPSVKPCDKCDACREIAAGNSLDVLEIDGASNNGVDQVRELRETVKYAPVRGPYKIYIIDEVHMLSTAAFNALLKTLEEPPRHVKFIFATTEPEKVLATIVSRCQRFDLRRIGVLPIIELLKEIAADEKVKIDDDALLAVARGSEGGLRDAESALDQLISFKGKSISEEDVLSIFGLASRSALENLGASILDGDIAGLVNQVGELDEHGKNLQRVVMELMEHFRNLLVCKHVADASGTLDLTAAQIAALQVQAAKGDTDRILRITDMLAETEGRMRYALSKRTLLETALIRCARAAQVVTLEEIIKQINALKAGGVPLGAAPAAGGRVAERQADVYVSRQAAKPAKQVRAEVEPAAELPSLQAQWKDVIEKVGKVSPPARRGLHDTRPVRVEKDRLVIGYDPEFAAEIGQFEHIRNRRAVEHVVGVVLGRDVTVAFEEAALAGMPVVSAPPEAPAERDAQPEAAPVDASRSGGRKTMGQWAKEPAVARTLDMFDGQIRDVRE